MSRMLRTLLPFIGWDDPVNLHVTVFEGGVGGINDHEIYVSDDPMEVGQVLKKYVQEGKSVYAPTNQKRCADNLASFCIARMECQECGEPCYRSSAGMIPSTFP